MIAESTVDRRSEWFVPSWGPLKVRVLIGLLFLPYTGMVLAYTIIGALLAEQIHWDRVGAILLIYFLALGIGAHALDAVGSTAVKPWETVFSKGTLWTLAFCSIAPAYAVGLYYTVAYAPLLFLIAIVEGFFLFAYNLEWFNGRFHSDGWFAVSWGGLPVLAGYVLQTNRISPAALVIAISSGLLSLVEINASRPYKALKRHLVAMETAGTSEQQELLRRFETILKSVSVGVILLGTGLLVWRVSGDLFLL
ncbi:MAG: hypothetical protein U0236_08310 [Nitrospira sp.]